jgi:amino acid transporter
MGIGAMVGAGIFALLGQAGAIASSAVYLSFLAGGVIALLSGYSLGKLGARFPSSGGMVEYLVQGYGVGIFSGAMSVMMYLAALVSASLVARTFGVYAASFFPADEPMLLTDAFAAGIVLLFMLINLNGPKSASWVETGCGDKNGGAHRLCVGGALVHPARVAIPLDVSTRQCRVL